MRSKYQSIREFLHKPFWEDQHEKNIEYDKRYRVYKTTHRIRFVGRTEIGDSFYVHLLIPSESSKSEGVMYDVIIRFFADTPELRKQRNFINYKVQFFSNSPGFMYKYAVLYKKHGFIIEQLYDKFDPDYADKLPEKTNGDNKLSFDSSIYYACRFLEDHHFRYLTRFGSSFTFKKTPKDFFAAVSSFKSIKADLIMANEEKKAKAELDAQDKKRLKNPESSTRHDDHKKPKISSQIKKGSTLSSSRVTAKKSTSGIKTTGKRSKISAKNHVGN